MSFIENPFLNNKNTNIYFDEYEGKNIEIDQTNVSKYFTHVFIITKKNNKPIPIDFYNWQINKDIFENVNSNLLIHKTSINILKNKTHFNNCILLSNEQLYKYNIFNYELADKNIIIPIFNIEYKNLLQYLEQYESNNTVQNIYNIKVLNKYFNIDDSNFNSNEFICQIISNLEETNYWTKSYNCLINMSDKFKSRSIRFQYTRMTDKNIASIIKKIFDSNINNNAEQKNYIKELEINTSVKKNNYVDISSVIEKKNTNYYKININDKNEFTRKDINQLFAILNEKQQFLLFANLIASKKYCHLVLNNEHILEIMDKQIKKFAPFFKYLISYAWIRFYTEECIKKSWIKTSDDFIFDINTASKLPVFPFNHDNPKENPYSPILISDHELNPGKNLCGIGDYSTEHGPQGICNLKEFEIRMNIFCTRNPNSNLFQGFDFEKYKVGISGSIITACLQKFHPLMSRLNYDESLTEKFNNYFDEYYANSDIDVMFMIKNKFEFIENVREFYNQIVINITKFNYNTTVKPSDIKLILNKVGYIFVNEKFINKNINLDDLDDSAQITNKVKYVIENIDKDIIKSKFQPFYEKLKIQKYNELIKNYSDEEIVQLKQKYPDIFVQDNIDFNVYVNNNINKFKNNEDITNISEQNQTEKDINLVYTYKYKIESQYLIHSLELFSIKYDDFLSIVSSFHLPCVRGYYNGSNVYLTPSCISAHMTFMNIDYKYFAGSKDPFDIINKYRMRGFGTWLNSKEKKLFVKYVRNIPFWNNIYSIDSKLTDYVSAKIIFGTISLNHKLFRPRLYNSNLNSNLNSVDTCKRYNNTLTIPIIYDNLKSINDHIQEKFNSVDIKEINWNNFISIYKNGYIVPFKKWIIDSVWNIYESEYKQLKVST